MHQWYNARRLVPTLWVRSMMISETRGAWCGARCADGFTSLMKHAARLALSSGRENAKHAACLALFALILVGCASRPPTFWEWVAPSRSVAVHVVSWPSQVEVF